MKNLLIIVALLSIGLVGCDERHKAKIYKTKKHHYVMKDDRNDWWVYTIEDGDIKWNSRGEMVLPRGGSWRTATKAEEEEVTVEGLATNEEETTVEEAEDGAPDGEGDVGGDSGGEGGDAGDSGGDGGDGGE